MLCESRDAFFEQIVAPSKVGAFLGDGGHGSLVGFKGSSDTMGLNVGLRHGCRWLASLSESFKRQLLNQRLLSFRYMVCSFCRMTSVISSKRLIDKQVPPIIGGTSGRRALETTLNSGATLALNYRDTFE